MSVRVSSDIIYERGDFWFEVRALRSSGDTIASGSSRASSMEALDRAIASACLRDAQDQEDALALRVLELLRQRGGVSAVSS